ncbi:MAG TPA: phosphopantetheine-binding protein [Verrucomicrobiae bacterium]|jgi:acyl carrier protein|nr:phosphopantetheine-binding protein [Verrucomicrobiae bacterium]
MEPIIFEKVQETLANALGVEKSDIKPESSLTRDLGAESIDFIDIMFRLEKTFDIKIPSGDLFPGNILNDPRFVQSGTVTAAGLQELRTKLPYLDVDGFSRDPQISRLAEFFTVQMVLDYLGDRLAKNVRTT